MNYSFESKKNTCVESSSDPEEASADNQNDGVVPSKKHADLEYFQPDSPISIIGNHLEFMVASTPQCRFVYWKGMEPPELHGYDTRLVACMENLPYQDGSALTTILEEETGSTELVTNCTCESYSDRHVYVANQGNGHRDNELPEDVSADEPTANAGAEDETQRDARRARNRDREQRRANARQHQQQQAQRNLQEEFERAAEKGFHTPMSNIMYATRLLDHINDPAVLQSINLLQHAALQLNEKEKLISLSKNQDQAAQSHTAGGRPRH